MDIFNLCCQSSFKEGSCLIANLLWQLWKARNNKVFSKLDVDPVVVWNLSLQAACELPALAPRVEVFQQTPTVHVSQRWSPPTYGYVKLNYAISMDSQSGVFGMAIVLRDESGLVIGGVSNMSSSSSTALAEALALRLTVRTAKRLNFRKFLKTVMLLLCGLQGIPDLGLVQMTGFLTFL
ncbi:hypothetical protein V6N13_142920 [Hibiscus sabdariffa]